MAQRGGPAGGGRGMTCAVPGPAHINRVGSACVGTS